MVALRTVVLLVRLTRTRLEHMFRSVQLIAIFVCNVLLLLYDPSYFCQKIVICIKLKIRFFFATKIIEELCYCVFPVWQL